MYDASYLSLCNAAHDCVTTNMVYATSLHIIPHITLEKDFAYELPKDLAYKSKKVSALISDRYIIFPGIFSIYFSVANRLFDSLTSLVGGQDMDFEIYIFGLALWEKSSQNSNMVLRSKEWTPFPQHNYSATEMCTNNKILIFQSSSQFLWYFS